MRGHDAFRRLVGICRDTVFWSFLAGMLSYASANTLPGTFVYLDKLNWNGSGHHTPGSPAKVGGWARGPTIAYSHEAIVKFDLSSVSGALQFAKLRFRVTGGVTGVHSTVTAFEVNQGAWSPSTVTYDTFCNGQTGCVSWTAALGSQTVNAAQTGWYEIEGASLLSKVQEWVTSPSSNNGLVLSGDFFTHEYYVDVDQVELLVDTELPAGDPYTAWPRRTRITLNTSLSGANATGAVQNFPLFVRLDGQNFNFDEAKDNGSDLRFSRNLPTGSIVELPVQIERWDKAGKKAEVWVKVDKILGNDNLQFVTLHWGHPNPPAPPSTPVFSSSNGFVGVWHLNENPGFSSGGYKDATSAGNHGTAVSLAAPPVAISSQVATVGNGAQYEDGHDQFITIPNESQYDLAEAVTLSMWMTADSWNTNYQALIAKGDHAWRLGRSAASGNVSQSYLHFATDIVGNNHLNGTFPLNADTWYHVVATYDRLKKKIYIDGVKRDEKSATAAIAATNSAVHLGNNSEEPWRSWDGFLDEVRIENVARSADWIKLCYESQRPDQRLLRFQSQYFPRSGGPVHGNVSLNGYTLNNVSMVVTKKISVPVPDNVLLPGYKVPGLSSVEAHIQKHRHLPGVPSAAELERDGMDIAAMNMHLLKQVEHLHLYLLDQDKRLRKLEERKKAKP